MARFLLDSHIVYWAMGEPDRLRSDVRSLLESGVEAFVSAATLWELNIKAAKGRLVIPSNFEQSLMESGFNELGVRWHHAQYTQQLPKLHGDPFDRLLIAQAITEELTLISRDKIVAQYPVSSMQG